MEKYLQPIGDVKQSKLRPAITSGYVCSEEECRLLSPPCLYVGQCIPILKEIAPKEFQNLIRLTKALTNQIAGRQSKTAETVNNKIRDMRKYTRMA